jgi:predicted transcriptional regulator
MKNQAEKIREYLLRHIPQHPHDIVLETMRHFKVSRTTVRRHMNHLVKKNLVLKTGSTKRITYTLRADQHLKIRLPINSTLDEFSIFTQYFDEPLRNFANEAAYNICEYGVTEMINNAKDHSSGKRVDITMEVNKSEIHIKIIDDGIGVFENILQKLNYESYPELIVDLSKGKLTTDPTNHTGEGIFFTARVFDRFCMTANGYSYFTDNLVEDWSFHQTQRKRGTIISLIINCNTTRNLLEVFKAYQDSDSLAFNKTEVKVRLAKFYGERLISRSQAKRVVRNLEKFNHVILDFKNVVAVGQGFADEIFRVYKAKHPKIKFDYCNANNDVEFMIKRSKAGST